MWYLNPSNHPRTKYRVYANKNGTSLVCDVDGAFPQEDNLSHARLIAAAPEMLETLQLAIQNETPMSEWVKLAKSVIERATC